MTSKERIRSHRLAKRWTQDRLAQRAGVARITVIRAEQGILPTPLSQQALAEALGVEREELFPSEETV